MNVCGKRYLALKIILPILIVGVVILVCVKKIGVSQALYSELLSCDHSRDLDLNISSTTLYFYDFENNVNLSYPILNAAEELTRDYSLNVSKHLIFFVLGFTSHINKTTEELVRQTFRNVSNTYLIIIDHSAYTFSKGSNLKSYGRSVTYVYYIGKALAKFLIDLHERGYPSKNIHCIGHSLGGQMLGVVGSIYMKKTGEKIWRITGLDPAGPCFSNNEAEYQIRSGIAEYVEVYHCNAGVLGTISVLADADFFFNKKGKKQVNCHEGLIPAYGESKAAKCSHKACVTYYAASVHHKNWYPARACGSYQSLLDGSCSSDIVATAGYSNPGNATGIFYVSTDAYDL